MSYYKTTHKIAIEVLREIILDLECYTFSDRQFLKLREKKKTSNQHFFSQVNIWTVHNTGKEILINTNTN